MPWLAPRTAAARVAEALGTLIWRGAGVFLLVGVIELVWNRRRYKQQLRMTKHEVREEVKKQEQSSGQNAHSPDSVGLGATAEATAVIVNPTHYGVAIRYSIETPGAPRVVAKGKNYSLDASVKQFLNTEFLLSKTRRSRGLYIPPWK